MNNHIHMKIHFIDYPKTFQITFIPINQFVFNN